jgi:hypothetical protein
MRIPGIPYVQGRNSYRDADDRKFGIAIHATANTASDSNEASYATRRPDGTSAHLYADADSVTQSLDTEAKAGHAGSGTGNENAYAVEITGLNSWTRQQWLDRVAWDRLGYCLAWLIRNDPDLAGFQVRRASVAEMKANPKVRAFYGHNDMRLAWGGTDHTDPGGNFPWDRLLGAVSAAIGGTAAGGSYSVADSQLIANAERAATALVAGTEVIKFDYPWNEQAKVGYPNPLLALRRDLTAVAGDVAALKSGGVDPAAVAALVVEQLGPLLPTLADIEEIIDAKVKAAINATHLSV